MGAIVTSLKSKQDQKILMVGLDGAGKSTILEKLKLGEIESTTPIVGFTVESVQYKNIHFTAFDVYNNDKIRTLFRQYYKDVTGLIFVIDSADSARLDDARNELQKMIHEDELSETSVLIWANKQDLPKAKSTFSIQDMLAIPHRTHRIVGCCATTGEGIEEGLDWLLNPKKFSEEMTGNSLASNSTSFSPTAETVAFEKASIPDDNDVKPPEKETATEDDEGNDNDKKFNSVEVEGGK